MQLQPLEESCSHMVEVTNLLRLVVVIRVA